MLNGNIRGVGYIAVGEGKGVPAGYSDALNRTLYEHNTLHSKTCKGFVVQGSNLPEPDESSDADWVTLVTATDGFATLPCVTCWIRIKGLSTGDVVYMQSIGAKY